MYSNFYDLQAQEQRRREVLTSYRNSSPGKTKAKVPVKKPAIEPYSSHHRWRILIGTGLIHLGERLASEKS